MKLRWASFHFLSYFWWNSNELHSRVHTCRSRSHPAVKWEKKRPWHMDERGRMGLNAVLISKKLSTNFQLRVFVVRPGSYSMIAHRWASSQMLAQTNLRFDPESRSRKTPPARPGSKFIFSRKNGWPFEWNFKCESLNAPASRLMMQPIVHQLRRSRPGTVLHLDQIR